MDNKEIWKNVLLELSKQIKKSDLITWFKNTILLKVQDNTAIIGVPTVFTRDWLNNKYELELVNLLRKFLNEIEAVQFEVSTALANSDDGRTIDIKKLFEESGVSDKRVRKVRAKMEVRLVEGITSKLMNPKYTLENFVVGPENRLAHAACSAVAGHPGGAYNPLFVYGGVGLGKTHLLQAVGNEILNNDPNAVVVYLPSERFINEIVEAIGKRNTIEFRSRYRKVDCLIVDDIQFLAHKEMTQVEFFHTFNDIFEAHKQLILSSDRPPKELNELHDRLRSRFAMGMIVDVQFPGYETRLAILQQKCREHQVLIAAEVLEYIAYNVRESVRELEGVLLQAIAQAQLENRVPTLKSVADMMVKLDKKMKHEAVDVGVSAATAKTVDDVINVVSEYYRVSRSELVSEARRKEVIMPRQVCMYLIRSELNQSFERIGKDFGGKNHTTVMHACEKIVKQLKYDQRLLKDVSVIKREMGL